MIIIPVLGGSLGKSGELTLLTVLRLRMALFLAKRLHKKSLSYEYVFPQGRKVDHEKMQRPCDVMSLWIFQHDRYCFKVNVPAAGDDLITKRDRLDYVKSVAERRRARVLRKRDFRKVRGWTSDFEEGSSHDTYLSEVASNVFQIRP